MRDFMLRYRGKLTSNGDVREKSAIREYLRPQLAVLCDQNPLFQPARHGQVNRANIVNGKVELGPMADHQFFSVTLGGVEFVPIVNDSIHKLVAEIDIIFLRRGRRGSIVRHGGDLDNRLKTLFDALRMPKSVAEAGNIQPPPDGERYFCLLEDDALVTKTSVTTYELLEPPPTGNDSEVDLLLHVTVTATSPSLMNLIF
jgi:hypothetical protein